MEDKIISLKEKYSHLYFFGAGGYLKRLIKRYDISILKKYIDGICVSENDTNESIFEGFTIKCYKDCSHNKDSICFILTVSSKYYYEIINTLRNNGFENIIPAEPVFHIEELYNNEEFMNNLPRIHKYCEDFLLHPKPFKYVECETVNRCNGSCEFCPVNVKQPQREYRKMTESLFHKIVDELSEINYDGFFNLFSNNEPLLDKRIINFAAYARKKLPKSSLCLFTNGILLNENNFTELIKYIDYFQIDDYTADYKSSLNDSLVKQYNEIVEKNHFNGIFKIEHIEKTMIRSTRGGQSPNNRIKEIFDYPCILPFVQIVIRPDGKLSLCCNDALGENTLGDINNSSLLEVWNSKKYNDVRKQICDGRKNITTCRYCNNNEWER